MVALPRFLLRKEIIHFERVGQRSVYRLSRDCCPLLLCNTAFVSIDYPAILVQQFLEGGSLFVDPFDEALSTCN